MANTVPTGAPTPVDRVLQELHGRIAAQRVEGSVADYIPELSTADPEAFGIALTTAQGEVHEVGETRTEFTIQSISKAVLYGMALEDLGGEAVAEIVGVEPSGEAFNSIRLSERNTPLNPMVNAGAIATTGLIRERDGVDPETRIVQTFSRYAGRPLGIDERVYRSERDTGHRNRAIVHLLRNFSVVGDDPEAVLDLYFRQCSILVTCRDLAVMGATLANRGLNPVTGERALDEDHVPGVLSVMATCGMYDFAGQWLHDIGLPAKSGVAGGIIAVLPGQLGIGTWSPPLDAYGNSIRGIRACRALSGELDLHLLDPPRPGAAAAGVGAPARGASRRRRSAAAAAALAGAADRITLQRPQGDLTFAVAAAGAQALLDRTRPGDSVVIDLSDVGRLDGAGGAIIAGLADSLDARGARLLLAGLGGHPGLRAALEERVAADGLPVTIHADAEQALEWCEDHVLDELGVTDEDGPVPLAESDLCRRMSDAEIAELEAAVTPATYAAGQTMAEEGAPSDHLIVIISGHAQVVTRRADGSPMRVITVGPGMFAGEMGLIDGRARSASIVAESDVSAVLLTRRALEGLSDTSGAHTRSTLLLNIAESLSSHLRRATALLVARS